MSLTHVGTLSLGAAMPMTLSASAALSASIGLVLPALQAQIAGLLELQADVSLIAPSLEAQLELLKSLVLNLEIAIAEGVPGVDFQILAVAALLAEVKVSAALLTGTVEFGAELAALLEAGGIDLYVWAGRVDQLGGSLALALAGGLPGGAAPGDSCDAVVLAASSPVAASAIAAMFRKAA